MAKLSIYTSEKYSIEIPERLLEDYNKGLLDKTDLLEKLPEIWDCFEYTDVENIEIEE